MKKQVENQLFYPLLWTLRNLNVFFYNIFSQGNDRTTFVPSPSFEE